MSWPCTAFCCWVALNEARGCDLTRVKKEGRLHLALADHIFGLRREKKAPCSGENPWPSRAWK